MKSGNLNFLEPSGPIRGPGSSVGIATDYRLDSELEDESGMQK